MAMSAWRCFALVVVVAWVLGSSSVSASTQSVAMVTDVAGRVTGPEPVAILSGVAAGTRLQMGPGAKLVVIYLKSGDEYSFTGPAQIEFRAGDPHVISGAKPQKQASPLGKRGNVRIRPMDVTQAGLVMRKHAGIRIKLLNPSATTLETSPEFHWQQIDPKAKYRFELVDDAGKPLYEAEVAGGSLKLPGSVQLREGATYKWEVSTRLSDGRRYANAGDFNIAAPSLRSQADVLRSGLAAPVSERVVYAVWLEQAKLRDEARTYSKTLAAERPGDENLAALAAQ